MVIQRGLNTPLSGLPTSSPPASALVYAGVEAGGHCGVLKRRNCCSFKPASTLDASSGAGRKQRAQIRQPAVRGRDKLCRSNSLLALECDGPERRRLAHAEGGYVRSPGVSERSPWSATQNVAFMP